MSGNILSLAGWYFLPNLLTGWLHSFYYSLTIRAGDPKPHPGTARFAKHRRNIFVFVIVAYLLYTIYEADWQVRRDGDFYQDLGVRPDVDEKTLQSRFRRLTVLHHPDKVTSAEAGPSAEAYYVHLKQARDTLVNPAKRFAYDRFGPQILKWQHCVTIHDYIMAGLQVTIPYYAASGLFMMVMATFGYLEYGRYWRYLTFVTILVFELHTITRPTFSPMITAIFNPTFAALNIHPPYIPFQTLILARRLAITVFVALAQLSPVLQKRKPGGQALQQQLSRLDGVAKTADQEASRLLALDMAPFRDEEELLRTMRTGVKEWLVQNTIRSDPEVRRAIHFVLNKPTVDPSSGGQEAQ